MPTETVMTPIVANSASLLDAAIHDVEQVSLTLRDRSGNIEYEIGGVQTSDIATVRDLLKNLKPASVQIFVKVNDEIPFQSAMSIIALCKSCGHDSAAWFPHHER